MLLMVWFLSLAPVLSTAQSGTPAGQAASPAPQPEAPKMASDDVLALLEKGDLFFLDVREPKELENLGTFEGSRCGDEILPSDAN